MQTLPKVTIVTVTYNAAEQLEATLQSICKQTYPAIEYIVIDGGSTDGSQEIIRRHADKISYWVSEPDGGIYPAMNKSLQFVTGEYVNFMNAGDWFLASDSIERLIAAAPAASDMIYGHHQVRHNTFVKHKKAGPPENLWRGNIFVHQALFARSRLLKAAPFNTTYPIAADFDFFFRQYQKGAIFFNTGQEVCSFAAGGVSDLRVLAGYREIRQIVGRYKPDWRIRFFHQRLLWKQHLIVGLRKLLPISVFEWLMRIKNGG